MNRINIDDVDLNLFKVFEALAEEGGASRAAIRLNMTQSAVSAALRRLREVFSDALFVRTGRGLAPTSRAKELKPIVSEALDRCRQSLAIASPEATSFHGRSISVGMSDDFEIALGRQLIETVARTAPGVRLIFRQTHSQIVSDALANQEMDLAVFAGAFAGRGLRHQLIGEGSYACLIDATQHKKRRILNIDEFTSRAHVLVSSGGVVGIVDEVLAAIGKRRTVIASTTHFASLPHLLKGTKAVATIPEHAAVAISRMTGLALLPCPIDLPKYPVAMGWRSNAMRDAAIVRVHAAIVGCFEASVLRLLGGDER
jgi:DNA-binding transcriptional LysR family regulator